MPRTAVPSTASIYRQFAHMYDRLFAPAFARRIHQTIRSLELPAGARILEVGVGTGLSLESYPSQVEVTGVDISSDMLRLAAEKIDAMGWRHIQLQQMDALSLDFPDDSFDLVTAFHVVTVIPDVSRAMQEMMRVCKPDGRLVIINHLQSDKRLVAGLMGALNPVTKRLGWRTDLRYGDLVSNLPLAVERRFKTSPVSLFTVVVANNRPSACPPESVPLSYTPHQRRRRRRSHHSVTP